MRNKKIKQPRKLSEKITVPDADIKRIDIYTYKNRIFIRYKRDSIKYWRTFNTRLEATQENLDSLNPIFIEMLIVLNNDIKAYRGYINQYFLHSTHKCNIR